MADHDLRLARRDARITELESELEQLRVEVAGYNCEHRAQVMANLKTENERINKIIKIQSELIAWYESEFERYSQEDVCDKLLDIEERLVHAEQEKP